MGDVKYLKLKGVTDMVCNYGGLGVQIWDFNCKILKIKAFLLTIGDLWCAAMGNV
jgi:hypothetical protein